jgi:hypothetical protein
MYDLTGQYWKKKLNRKTRFKGMKPQVVFQSVLNMFFCLFWLLPGSVWRWRRGFAASAERSASRAGACAPVVMDSEHRQVRKGEPGDRGETFPRSV